MNAEWSTAEFEDCIEPVEYTRKIQRNEFLESGRFPVISQESAFINGYWDDEADVFAVRTPVVLFGDHTKSLKYVDFDFVLGADGVKVLRPRPFLLPKFFYYALQSVELGSLGYARHYRLLKERQISWPERDEQQRIVAVLDEAFAGIAAARANAERNLGNARALFEESARRAFSTSSNAWPRAPLSQFCTAVSTGPFGSMLHKSDYVADGVPLVNPINIVGGEIVPDWSKCVGAEAQQRLRAYSLRRGDVVIGRRGEMGRCAVVGENEAGWICGTGCFFVRPAAAVDPDFLAALLRSPEYRSRLEAESSGATMPNLSNRTLADLTVAVPDAAEQAAVLSVLQRASRAVDQLEDVYQRKLAALDELKRSLLHHAFTGQLTARAAAATPP